MSRSDARVWGITDGKEWSLDRPRILAILNLTPDSFSDGGELSTVDSACRAAEAALVAGADGLDIGGESTRPGAARIPAAEQIRRTTPTIEAIRRRVGDGPVITIDTTLSEVARAALDAGADAINDVAAGLEDDAMLPLAAARRCGIILMHRLAPPGEDVYSHRYAQAPSYEAAGGVVAAVEAFLRERAEAAMRAGVERDRIVIDPGLGFGKTVEQNLELIRQTPRLAKLGWPVLSGLSRKSFVARAAGLDPDRHPPRERVSATVGLSVAHALLGASIFRVHDVGEHVGALRAAAATQSVRHGDGASASRPSP